MSHKFSGLLYQPAMKIKWRIPGGKQKNKKYTHEKNTSTGCYAPDAELY
jgi:hypothetical protein